MGWVRLSRCASCGGGLEVGGWRTLSIAFDVIWAKPEFHGSGRCRVATSPTGRNTRDSLFQRVGARAMPRQIQLETMDEALRASLWNALLPRLGGENAHWDRAAAYLAKELFKIPVDTVPPYNDKAYQWVRARFFEASWHEAYDLLEFLVNNVDVICNPPSAYRSYYSDQRWQLTNEVNDVLERELSGYRFVSGSLVPLSDPTEIAAIEEASQTAVKGGVFGAHQHIAAALRLLGQKPQPDYRNSIKESISAVEATVNVIMSASGNGVAEAVEALAERTEIHGALKAALKQLYGFSSDADGVRHAIMEQTTVGYDEAKFMLVACAAFVNFIFGKASKAGLT
jgi:hypothetical protein